MAGHGNRKQGSKPADRKQRKKAYREANSTVATTMAGTSIPLVIPGTTTRLEHLRQARRWLGNERRVNPPRFARQAIQEVEQLFHTDHAVRTAHPFSSMSPEAKYIVTTLQAERALAEDGGGTGDWWDGPVRRGVTTAQQKDYKMAKEMATSIHKGETDTIGLGVEGEEVGDEALGAISYEGVDFAGWTFDHVGYEDSDDSLAEEEEAKAKEEEGEAMDMTEG
ncbi:MAG: hypothetical protein Q9204_007196 [Flavoplaca sp. TL-2023a]